MASEIKYSLYKDSPELEATRLRSILLFNDKVKTSKRQDLITKAVLSLILAKNGSAKREGILNELNSQFSLNFSPGDLDAQILKLFKLGLLKSVDEPLTVKDSDKGRSYFEKLEQNTEALLDGILEKVVALSKPHPVQNPDPVKRTIRKALSVYYSMNGYTFFRVQKKEDEIPIRDAAIKLVKDELKDNRLAECVIRALAEVIEKPNDEQLKTLTQWARAFVAMESMSLDPLLNNLKSKNLREKEFIVDTDVVLHCLTSKARYSSEYCQMIAKLKDLGCKMYLVPEVVTEVQKHIDAAKKCYRHYGLQLTEFPDDMLYEEVCNVFIDDYVHIEREAKESTPFNFYIEEFHDPEYPALLQSKLTAVFSKPALDNTLEVDTLSDDFLQLEEEILKLTMKTPKAQNRTDEDNQAVSHLDAFLYMAALNKNLDLDITKMLSGKTYILSDSTRALRAANNLGWQRNDVVCHPNALMALLMEIGDVKSQESIINLFDNPFLAYVADSVWGEIEALLKKKAYIKYKGFDKLRADVDKSFDKWITTDIPAEERRAALSSYGVYLPEMVDEQQAEIEKMQKEITGLKKSLAKSKMANAKKGNKLKSSSPRNKRKKKP